MAHHGSEPPNRDMLNDIFGDEPSPEERADESVDRMQELFGEQMKAEAEHNELGATGQFPEGRITNNDEGELRFGVADSGGRVILNFGTQVTWVGMMPNQARQLAKMLMHHADAIEE